MGLSVALLPWGQWEVELQPRINGGTCAAAFRCDGRWYCCEGLRRRGSPLCCGLWKERHGEQQWKDETEEVVRAWEIQYRVRWEGKARFRWTRWYWYMKCQANYPLYSFSFSLFFSFKACDSFICGFTAWIFAFQSCFLLVSAAQNT